MVPVPVLVPTPVPVTPVTPVPVRPPQFGGMVVLTELKAPGAAPGFVLLVGVAVVLDVALPDVPTPVVRVVLLAEGVQLVVALAPALGVCVVEFDVVVAEPDVCVGMPVVGPLDTLPVAPPLCTVPVGPLEVEVPVWAAAQAADASSNKLVHRILFIFVSGKYGSA